MKELLKRIVQADSTVEKGELNVARIIAEELAKSKIDSKIDMWDQNRANLVVHLKSSGPKPALLFACHMDVVEPGEGSWKYPPFSAVEADGKIFGRGSADMKAGTAAIVTALRQIADSGTRLLGDVIVLAAAGEESDSCGAKRFMESAKDMPDLAGIIIPEPTDFDVVTAHNGALWLNVRTTGKTAHGATPQLGVNALSSMRLLMDEIDKYKEARLPEGCSLSINTIKAGKDINVVPDLCHISIDIRTTADITNQDIIDGFKGMFNSLKQKHPDFEADVSIARDVNALRTDEDIPFVKDFCDCVSVNEMKAVGYCTDGPFLADLNAPTVIFGPGKPEICHKPDEYVDLADVERAVELYKKIILKFLA